VEENITMPHNETIFRKTTMSLRLYSQNIDRTFYSSWHKGSVGEKCQVFR